MAKIGVFDSGVGGLSVYKEIRKVLPKEKFFYFSDNAFCPYGEKTPEFIRERGREITELFLSKGVQAVVVACNTATAASIEFLRSTYDIPFVGMEPAVKPAALGTKTGVIGVLATAGTLKASKYIHTRDLFTDGTTVVERVGKGFVELVESGMLEGPRAEDIISRSLFPLLEQGADTIVLGCTHYPFLLKTMQKLAGEGIRFVDPAPAVARQLVKVLDSHGITTGNETPGTELMSSGPGETLKRTFSLLLEGESL